MTRTVEAPVIHREATGLVGVQTIAEPRKWRFPTLRRWNLDSAQTAILAGVLLLTLLVYLRCLENRFVYDDVIIVLHNHYIAQPSYIWKSLTRDLWWFLNPKKQPVSQFYQPLQGVWLGVAYQLFGSNPVGWHVLKIGLHLVVVVLSFRVAQLLTGSTEVGLLAALLFGIMPVHVEPVVWATDIPEPLSAAFEMGSFCLFIQHRNDGWNGLTWPLLLFVGASFSHEMAVVFPMLIALYVYMFETTAESATGGALVSSSKTGMNRERLRRAAMLSAPFFAISAIYLAARAMVLGARQVLGITPKMETVSLVGTKIVPHFVGIGHGVLATLLSLPNYLLCYLEVLVIPWLAGPAHNVAPISRPGLYDFYIPTAILTLATILGYFAIRRSPRRKLYMFCAAWWLVTLSPALLNLDQVISEAHDRYQYLGSFAFCVILADLGIRCWRSGALRAVAASVCTAALVVTYLVVLWRLQPVWRNDFTLFTRITHTLPDSVHFHLALAGVLTKRGDLRGALTQYLDAEKVAPDEPDIHMALGTLYLKMHRAKRAANELEAAFRTAFGQKKQPKVPHWSATFR